MLSKQYMSACYIESSLYRIQLTPDNSNLPPTRSNFCFPSDHFYVIRKKKTVYWNPKHCIQLKTTVSIFCPPLFLVTPVQIQCPFPCVSYQALLLNSLFTISIFISCCLWSEVCMILAFLPHPFAYFQLFVPNSR